METEPKRTKKKKKQKAEGRPKTEASPTTNL